MVVGQPTTATERINTVDALNLSAVLSLSGLTLFFQQPLGEQAVWLLGIFACLFVFIFAALLLADHGPLWEAVHAFSPVLIIPVLFNTLGPIINCASAGLWDAQFAWLDAQLFGDLAAMWRGVLGRPNWFTDLCYFAYVGYYVTPVILAVVLYVRAPRHTFQQVVFTLVLTFYVSYVGYFLFPTLGPRAPSGSEALVVGGGIISDLVRLFIEHAELTRTDAFPSGHTAVALVCLYFAWRTSTMLFTVFIPLVAGTVFSTVYLHYHYVIDVVAGAAVAGGCASLAPRLESLFELRVLVQRFGARLGFW